MILESLKLPISKKRKKLSITIEPLPPWHPHDKHKFFSSFFLNMFPFPFGIWGKTIYSNQACIFFLQAKTNNKLLKKLHGITRHIYLNIVLDHRHGKIWKVKIELYWFSRFAISIPYQTNSLSLSETLETSMPILGLKACMQLHKGRKCNMYIRRQSCKLLIK